MKRSEMVKVAKLEINAWHSLPRGLVLAILFAFIHRLTTGDTVEETFLGGSNPPDYQI